MVPRLIEHMKSTQEWGECIAGQYSYIPYNQSLAQRYFPLTKEQAVDQGYRWYEGNAAQAEEMNVSVLDDVLPATDASFVAKSIESDKPYLITATEIALSRKLHVPLPRKTYDESMQERMMSLGGISLYDRACAKTGKPIRTNIAPDTPWIVWDKDVYEQEFSG